MDHALADSYTVGLFMGHWASIHSRMFTVEGESFGKASLPDIVFNPRLLEDKVRETIQAMGSGAALLERARKLPTRRPDFRDKINEPAMQNTISNPSLAPSVTAPYLLHVSAADYERITRGIQAATGPQMTDQVAFVAFLWAGLNRARSCCSNRPALDLHLPTSFRWTLNLPQGLAGSPLVAVMMDGAQGSENSYTNPVALAGAITKTLEKYTEDAMMAVAYDASLRDSPESILRGSERRERMEFTSAVRSGPHRLSFGSNSPVFEGPIFLPVDNLFIMAEGLQIGESRTRKWYEAGASVFFSSPVEVFQALLADPSFSEFELLADI